MEISIRPYSDADQDQVIRLWEQVFPDPPAHNNPLTDIKIKQLVQPEMFLVALLDGKLVGTAMAGFDGHRGWVYYLGVDREYQRQGIGRALMNQVETRLHELGCPKLNLQIRGENHEVREFYQSLGYEVEDRLSMAKRL